MGAFDELLGTLRSRGIHAVLRLLNSRAPHRFTGMYRFDPPMLRSLYLYDAFAPEITRGEDLVLRETYCAIVGIEERPFAVENSLTEPRLASHPARETVISYCGVLIRDASGAPFGTLCHFDTQPCEVPKSQLPLMEQIAPYLHQAFVGAGHGREAR